MALSGIFEMKVVAQQDAQHDAERDGWAVTWE